MSTGDRVTGVRDEHYNLVSILYHALQGAETYDTYIRDAEGAGDQELAQFFRQVQEEERQRAARAKELLGRKLTQR
jgi:rubrerythrin